ncbi:hypothetical protein CHARACLAT_020957 [Characodon lateralis]|uniref:Uncharacterized protein n=1 Tax=Characodon lateralis TaxID=208331 RepID=A0ABU7EVH3_9TELE|nr:hypothetical protein [Characodon lateralis]
MLRIIRSTQVSRLNRCLGFILPLSISSSTDMMSSLWMRPGDPTKTPNLFTLFSVNENKDEGSKRTHQDLYILRTQNIMLRPWACELINKEKSGEGFWNRLTGSPQRRTCLHLSLTSEERKRVLQ